MFIKILQSHQPVVCTHINEGEMEVRALFSAEITGPSIGFVQHTFHFKHEVLLTC